MKSPYPKGYEAYQDHRPSRTLPIEEEKLVLAGYKFLGWNIGTTDLPELKHCMDEGHNYRSAFPNVWHQVIHTPSGSEVTNWCTKCKIYWKVDMS